MAETTVASTASRLEGLEVHDEEMSGEARFGEARSGEARSGDLGCVDLASELAAACARGRGAFDRIALPDGTFANYLTRVLTNGAMSPAALQALAVEDLYLACACLGGHAVAVATFRMRSRGAIDDAIKGIVSPSEAEDIREQFVQDLLVGTDVGSPKLVSYLGKAPLARWVSIGARRAALMWLRKSQTEGRTRRALAVDPIVKGGVSLETDYIKERYRSAFERALGEALARLSGREVVVLRLHLVNGVSIEKIGKVYKVSQSTVSRWLAAARSALLEDVKEALRRLLGTSSSGALASLARIVASRLELSLTHVLK